MTHEKKKSKALDLWQRCETLETIAKALDVTAPAIKTWEDEFLKTLTGKDFKNSSYFTPPIYNVWKQQVKSRWSYCRPRRWNGWRRKTRKISRGQLFVNSQKLEKCRFPEFGKTD